MVVAGGPEPASQLEIESSDNGETYPPTATSSPSPASLWFSEVAQATGPDDGRWQPLPTAPIVGRSGHVLGWSRGELIIWGGSRGDSALSDGAAFDPATEVWRLIAVPDLEGGQGFVGVSVADRLLVWGGGAGTRGAALYDPRLDEWTRATPAPVEGLPIYAAASRDESSVVMLGVGTSGREFAVRYHIASDSWVRMPPPTIGIRMGQTIISGPRGVMLVPGSESFGAWFDEALGEWAAVQPPPGLSGVGGLYIGGVSVDDEIYLWGSDQRRSDSFRARYNIVAQSWSRMAAPPVPPGLEPLVVWTGTHMILWGDGGGPLGLYNPWADMWTMSPPPPVQGGTPARQAGVWADDRLLAWGGEIPVGLSYVPAPQAD